MPMAIPVKILYTNSLINPASIWVKITKNQIRIFPKNLKIQNFNQNFFPIFPKLFFNFCSNFSKFLKKFKFTKGLLRGSKNLSNLFFLNFSKNLRFLGWAHLLYRELSFGKFRWRSCILLVGLGGILGTLCSLFFGKFLFLEEVKEEGIKCQNFKNLRNFGNFKKLENFNFIRNLTDFLIFKDFNFFKNLSNFHFFKDFLIFHFFHFLMNFIFFLKIQTLLTN